MAASAGSVIVRVLYADTDMAGVVYHANYLRFFEAARTQLMADAGMAPVDVQAEHGIVFTVTEVTLHYHDPARYGDELRIEVEPVKVGPARFTLAYRVMRPGRAEPSVTGTTTICALSLDPAQPESAKVVRLPAAVRAWLGSSVSS
ncbi:MAG: YbgC/FadM family acyl-CoA thioesterase [Armatimonadetes bacterium]|nr:YbgC/FadM family acyl-CoA thioesterase [Armatimonadota bacterium]